MLRTRRFFLTPYLFLLPGLFFFVTFLIYPLVEALRISLYDWKIMPGAVSPFVGLENYRHAFRDQFFGLALRNTVLYTAVTVPGQMVSAMLAAVLIDALPRGRAFYRTIYFLPVITSWVVVSLSFRYLFESSEAGLVNHILVHVLGIVGNPIEWLRQPVPALLAIMTVGIWKGVGFSMIIFLAALQSIPAELHEAAAIDGANPWQRLLRVTLPAMRPTVVFVLVLLTIGGFSVFPSVYIMTGGGPLHRTETILTYMYTQAFSFLEFGYGSALAYVLGLVVFAMSTLQIRFLRRPVEV